MQPTILMLTLLTLTPLLSAQDNRGASNAQSSVVAGAEVLANVAAVPEAPPRGPKELLDDYEAEMNAVTQRFSASISFVANAVQQGALTSEQGQKISAEQYQVAQIQFELLSAWHAMVEHDVVSARVPVSNTSAVPTKDNEIITLALPFSSFEFSSSVAEYLNVSDSQAEAIRQVMTRERRNIQPLLAKLKTTREKLLAVDARHTSEKHMKTLADREAGLLAKLFVANARMQSNIYSLLTLEQQRKLDDLKQSNLSATAAGK